MSYVLERNPTEADLSPPPGSPALEAGAPELHSSCIGKIRLTRSPVFRGDALKNGPAGEQNIRYRAEGRRPGANSRQDAVLPINACSV